MRKIIYNFINQRLNYFKIFADVAKYRKQQTQHSEQFKTERWFQTELLVHLWSKGYKVIPEYGNCRWDLYVHSSPESSSKYFFALNCLSNSAQNASRDYKNVKEDIDTVINQDLTQGEAYVILILPYAGKYTSAMLTRIKSHENKQILSIDDQNDLLFPGEEQDGVKFVLIKKISE